MVLSSYNVSLHGACAAACSCSAAGVDLITACDIRLCTQDAWFQVKVCPSHYHPHKCGNKMEIVLPGEDKEQINDSKERHGETELMNKIG